MPVPGTETALPGRLSWDDLRRAFTEAVVAGLTPWLASDHPYVRDQLAFAGGRLDMGVALLRHFQRSRDRTLPEPRDLLDVGTGNGGIAFAFANTPDYRVAAVDVGQNPVFRAVGRATGLPVRYALASGLELPYSSESFDVVVLVETIEHVPRARRLGREVMRVLRPAGVCFVSTPARLRYVFGRDPHYGVRGIAGLPNPLQRLVVDSLARRRPTPGKGVSWPAYDVEHLYWHVRGITSRFPGPKRVEALYSRPMSGGPLLSREWWRRRMRGFLFDHVVIVKAGHDPG